MQLKRSQEKDIYTTRIKKTSITSYAGLLPLSLPSIFLLAAKIISSRLLCNNCALSALFDDQPLLPLPPAATDDSSWTSDTFDRRPYFVIRSGFGGFVDTDGDACGVDGAGISG